jgi:hypothetical protein
MQDSAFFSLIIEAVVLYKQNGMGNERERSRRRLKRRVTRESAKRIIKGKQEEDVDFTGYFCYYSPI